MPGGGRGGIGAGWWQARRAMVNACVGTDHGYQPHGTAMGSMFQHWPR